MSTKKTNVLQDVLAEFAPDFGFERHKSDWYLLDEDVTTILNLQKSQYGRSYYLNLAWWLRQLGDERYPKPWHGHAHIRLEDATGEEKRHQVTELLNLENEISDLWGRGGGCRHGRPPCPPCRSHRPQGRELSAQRQGEGGDGVREHARARTRSFQPAITAQFSTGVDKEVDRSNTESRSL